MPTARGNESDISTHPHRWTSPFPSDSLRRTGDIGGGLHERPRRYFVLDSQNISSLSTSNKSRPVYPAPAWSWFRSLDTRAIPTPVSGFGEANPGVWPAGVFALPTKRHRPDGAHTTPGHTYGQRYERAAIQGKASMTE